MAKPSKTINVNGEDCVTTADAAARLEVSKGRVLHFIHEQRLRSIQFEENGAHYIPITSLEEFAKLRRPRGRPKPEAVKASKKPAAKKASRKSAKK
jgi:hypothetical protein